MSAISANSFKLFWQHKSQCIFFPAKIVCLACRLHSNSNLKFLKMFVANALLTLSCSEY